MIARHRYILEYALSSLLRRAFRNLALITVFTAVVAILASILFFTHAFRTEAVQVLSGAPELIVQRVMGGRHDLIPHGYGDVVKRIPGVGSVIPRSWGYYFDEAVEANYTVLGWNESDAGSIVMIEGNELRPGVRGSCVIGKGVSDARFAGIGGSLSLRGGDGVIRRFTVTGIFTAESAILTNDLILMSDADVRDLFGIPAGFATDMVVQVHNPAEIGNVARKIKDRFPDSRPITKQEIIRTYNTLFNWRSGLMLTVFLGALAAFSILAWDKATGLSADERREIGILKAIGWETSDILALKFWEGTAVSLTAFLSGILLAYLHVFFFGASLFAPVLRGWSVLFPKLRLIPYLNAYQITVLFLLTVAPYIAATIVPSWKAAITDPDSVMRG